MNNVLEQFHPIVRSWFTSAFGEPSLPQQLGWPSIASGKNTLIVAPTGSGKTLAAFLWCINHLVEENILRHPLKSILLPLLKGENRSPKANKEGVNNGVRVLYISPLKALNNDIHRNLEIPLTGILDEAKRQGIELPVIRSAVRTGDTTQSERNSILKYPPDILITTPESLYLMLSSEKARKIFYTVQYVIVDEIHSISTNKRGVHLSLSLERLEHLIQQSTNKESHAERSRSISNSFVRIGLSATQKPLETVAQFLGGFEWVNNSSNVIPRSSDVGVTTMNLNENKNENSRLPLCGSARNGNNDTIVLFPRPVSIINAGYKKNVDLKVICPVHDFTDMPLDSVWHAIYPELLKEIQEHRSTLIFVNNRRLAERLSAKLNELLEGTSDTTNNYAVPFYNSTNNKNLTPNTQDLKPAFQIYAYHGSMSRTVREQLESDLKSGKLKALITTSALELGIDIGSVDLVIQLQSPKGIARGLQRVGRSGHLVKAESKGRIFVTHRDDLLESTVVAQGMIEHAIERTSVPMNCLDVVAQQIVAMVSVEEWNVDDLFDCLRQSFCYHTLSEKIFHNVVSMIAGRYTNESFRELRARIHWDKLHNTLSALPGSSKLAIMNGGTIPDRGYFGVYLEDLKTKVGEVDEEFIYESRAGDTFVLGSNVWRMVNIDANKVVVQPAPGQPARMPFWRGESLGRTYELSVKIGEFLEKFSDPTLPSPLRGGLGRGIEFENFPIDSHSIRNITNYIEEQKEATHILPTHRTIIIEGFRDEIGDPRIVVHSYFGKGVNGLLGIVLQHELQLHLSTEIQMLYNDNGILFRCSDVERLPLDLFSNITSQSVQQIILENIPSSPLFGALFRQNATRALLLPKGNFGKRTPFFLQRLRSADLLQIVRQYNDFPIVIETLRECLNDVLDFEHFKEIISKIQTEEIQIHTVQNEIPSPFASSVLFDFAAVYMYEWDQPKNIVQQQFALLNRELISEVVELDAIKSVVRKDAVAKVEEQLQFTASTRKARSPEELLEVFLRLGELTENELHNRVEQASFIESLLKINSVIPIQLGEKKYFIATEELPIYFPICTIESAILEAAQLFFGETFHSFQQTEALHYVILRMLRSRGPISANDITHRFAISHEMCLNIFSSISEKENIVHGVLLKETDEELWCYRPNLDRIHRASINLLRKEIKPATMPEFTQLLLQWQHRHPSSQEKNEEGIQTILEKMQGYTLPSELWEAEIFRHRIHLYNPAQFRSFISRGESILVGTENGKSQWIQRGDGSFFLQPKEKGIEHLSPSAQKVYVFLKENGASHFSDMRDEMNLSLSSLNRSIAELFWNQLITNDIFDEVVNVKRYRNADVVHLKGGLHLPDERIVIVNPKRNPFRKIAMRSVRQAMKHVPGWNGRWSLVHTKNILGSKITDEEKIIRQAQQLLLRYGVVAREIAKREENFSPCLHAEVRSGTLAWSLLAMEFQRMEMRGEIRRGYFVEGLSGMQFALPDAVRMLDEIKLNNSEPPIVLNACDPANPYGVGVELHFNMSEPFASSKGFTLEPIRVSRVVSNFIVFENGNPLLWIENFGARIFFQTKMESIFEVDSISQGISQFIKHIRSSYPDRNEIIIEYCNNIRPSGSAIIEILRTLGFYRDKAQTMRLDLR